MADSKRPDFLGIGAQKAGTTWLYFALAHHPEIFMPDCKEVHFWDQHHDNGYAWYETLFAPAEATKTKGEITPAYAILAPEIIAEIAARYPQLKLISMVRDPVARAWSAALMDHKKTGLDFATTPDAWFLQHFRSSGSLARGDYTTCLRNWLRHFSGKQLLVLDYAAIKTDPRGMLKAVARHFGIDAAFFDILAEEHLTRPRNEGSGHRIRPTLQAELEKIYAGKQEGFRAFVEKEQLRFFTASA